MSPDVAMTTRDAVECVRRAPTLLAALELLDTVVTAARTEGPTAQPLLQAAVGDPDDHIVAITAVHAAVAAGTATARVLVLPLLSSGPPFLREHAAYALASSPRLPEAVPALAGMAAAGGFTGTLAEATLEAWGDAKPEDHDLAGDRVTDLRHDPGAPGVPGLTIAQLFLHADIDGSLGHAGQGDTGGIATLLVHLGDALLAEGTVDRVLTLSRGRPGEARFPADLSEPGHHYLSVPLPGPVLHAPEAWPLRVAVRRELRRILRAAGRIDVLHLRMADVGSWAAAEVAQEFAIPVVLTLAPDPHALIAAREASGALNRLNFGPADHAEHLVFRIRLLRDLADQAGHLVVFPRPNLARDLRHLLHLDPGSDTRVSVVPEGIDLAPLERAGREVPDALRGVPVLDDTATALAELDALLATLPPERRGLPLAITVGRLHRIKGITTLVDAWAADPALARRFNLLIVGGDLRTPTDEETEQLAQIDATIPRAERSQRGLLLAGHRPNATVAVWLAAVRHGRPGLCAPAGIYVAASLKEEFGIAILEAMASGLVVVAPVEGGPATYVEQGVTGVLVDTHSPAALAGALTHALDLAGSPDAGERAERARQLVTERFSITTMASALATVYAEVTHDAARHQS